MSPAEEPTPSPAAVVGVGASAGGLEALEKLFSLVPAQTGLAFVVIQHLERRHPSLLPELLARQARMPVMKAEDGTRPEPDHVYVIAPNTVLTLADGVLRVAPVEEGSPARIDAFFRSLAEDRGERAIGVLLSGAGMDGTAGFRLIKEHGGVTLAQDPRSAKHGSMPRTAIEAGLVDAVLGVDQLPAALVEHVRHLTSTQLPEGAMLDADIARSVGGICALLQQRTGHDFSGYKEPTLLRRIRRRVHVRHAASAAEYLEILKQDAAEPQRLLKDLLIGVTQFFRDPETFDKLATEILPRILRDRPAEGPVRIWVPGCASGEEAYSIAILLHEHLAAAQGLGRLLQIFATDIDAEMIAEARAGRYPADIEERVSPERLERYLVREPTGWHVGKDLREMCIFSVHSLIRDPPFSSLDLISCRNVLIYLEPDLQKRVIPLFHYALRRGGHLLLGPAEGILHHPELFEPVDKKHRIYRRRETVSRVHVDFPLSARAAARAAEASVPAATPQQKATAAIERMLLDEYAPPCAVVNVRGDIQFVAGRIGRYFAPPAGAPPTNVLEAFRESLRVELRSALQAATATGARIVRDGIPVEVEDDVRRVRLTVRPVPGADGLFAVVVQERAAEAPPAPEGAEAPSLPAALEQMEVELRHTRADLKSAIESTEAANEELRSANEELISTNEELQSANEELQTSKEELQSLNEELETVNSELRRNVDDLATANGDLQNLFASTDIATIFLDAELRVARFTPAATSLFRLIDGDVGRPISDLAPRFQGEDVVADAREVLRTGNAVERQVRAADRPAWFVLRVLPYRTAERAVAGVVVTFLDFTELKQAGEALLAARERAEWLASFPARNPVPIVEVDSGGRVAYANVAAEQVFPDLRGEGTRHPWLAGWTEVLRVFREEGVASHERVVTVGAASYQQNMYFVPETQCIRIYGVDVTQREQAEGQRERLLAELDATISSISDGVIVYGRSGSLSYMNPVAERILGFPTAVWDKPLAERSRMMRLATEAGVPVRGEETPVGRALRGETVPPMVLQHQRADDSKGWISVAAAPIVTAAGERIGVVATFSDVTERYSAQAERERLLAQVQLRAAELDATFASMASGIIVYGPEGQVLRMNRWAEELIGFTAAEWAAAGNAQERAALLQMTTLEGRPLPLERAPVPRALRGEATQDVQILVHTRGGRSTAVLKSAAPILGPDGSIHGAVATLADLTELQLAQDALRESDQRYAAIHDKAPIAIALNQGDGRFVSVNDAFTRLFEFPREELLGKTSQELGITPAESRARVAEILARDGSVRDFEVERRTRSGAPCVITLNVDRVEIGGEEHTLTTIQDVTGRKRSEDALQRSRLGLSRLADASLRVVRETDLDGMLQAVSEAALALTGARLATAGHGYVGGRFIVGGSARAPGAPACPPGDMFVTDRGGVHLDLVDGPDVIRLSDAQMRAHARWWGLPAEHVPMRGLLGVRMAGRDGQPSGMILVTDKIEGDFTEGDESLLRQLGTIASLALQHVEARISLEAADRSKNEFLAMLSHELRNPLAPIRNSLYVLDRAAPGGEQARRAQGIIGRQVSHLTRLVDDLLDVTRISRGKIQLQRERVDLGELLRRAAEDHRASFVNGGVDLEVTAPQEALFTVGDRTRLTQVVGNLLENAVKFTPRGGRATLSLEENAALRQAVVSVRDTGAGIAADMLPRLFQPFTQADTTLDRSKGGLGLGLALVRGLVEMHGGAVSADSDGPERGAVFTLRLPLDASAAPAPAPARTEPPAAVASRRRVLVIEDNVDSAQSLREALQLGGHVVEVAFSGAEGLARGRTFHPEVILCDIGLPVMNGYQVAQAVRMDPALRHVTLVALTGYAAPDDVARSRAAGFDAHVAKPATLVSLEAALSSPRPDELPRGRG